MSEMVVDNVDVIPRQEEIGIFQRLRRMVFGTKAAILTEEKIHIHWLTLVAMAMVSFFGVQIFASANFEKASHGDITSAIIVVTIIGTIIISDYAAPMAREMASIERARHNDNAARLLMWYSWLVYFADGYTCIEGLYRDQLNISSTTPADFFGVHNSGIFLELGIRGCLIIATLWTIHDVTKKRLPTEYTLASQGAGVTGGELLRRISKSDANSMSMPQLLGQFYAFTEISKRVPRGKKQEIEEVRMQQAKEKLQAILTADTSQSVQAVASMSSEIAALTSAVSELLQQMKESTLHGSKKPKATASSSETGYKAMLLELGIEPLSAVKRKDESSGKIITKAGVSLRGGWVNRSAIITLSDAQLSEEEATNLARSLGEGFKYGTSYAAPLTNVLKSLAERNKLHSVAQAYMIASAKTADTTDQ